METPNILTYTIGSAPLNPYIAIVAHFRSSERSGGSVQFAAVERGKLLNTPGVSTVHPDLEGSDYERPVADARHIFYPRQMMCDETLSPIEHNIALQLSLIADGNMGLNAARELTWSAFLILVAGNPDSSFFDAIYNHKFTPNALVPESKDLWAGIRENALAEHAKTAA